MTRTARKAKRAALDATSWAELSAPQRKKRQKESPHGGIPMCKVRKDSAKISRRVRLMQMLSRKKRSKAISKKTSKELRGHSESPALLFLKGASVSEPSFAYAELKRSRDDKQDEVAEDFVCVNSNAIESESFTDLESRGNEEDRDEVEGEQTVGRDPPSTPVIGISRGGAPSQGLLKKFGAPSPAKRVVFSDSNTFAAFDRLSTTPLRVGRASTNKEIKAICADIAPVAELKCVKGAAVRKKKGRKGGEDSGKVAVKHPGKLARKGAGQRLVEKVDEREEKLREARKRRRQSKKECFNCRQSGHRVDQCPQGSQTGFCFKCGGGDHMSAKCRAKIPEGEFPFAKCFICGETGHLSKLCPDNPRGLYPKGGGCKICGSVEHLKANCPAGQKRGKRLGGVATASPAVITNGSADAEDVNDSPPTFSKALKSKALKQGSKSKVVKF